VLNFELEVYRKDGAGFGSPKMFAPCETRREQLSYYEGTAEALTKRKRAEDALRASESASPTVVENLAEGVVVSDLKANCCIGIAPR